MKGWEKRMKGCEECYGGIKGGLFIKGGNKKTQESILSRIFVSWSDQEFV